MTWIAHLVREVEECREQDGGGCEVTAPPRLTAAAPERPVCCRCSVFLFVGVNDGEWGGERLMKR